MSCVCCTSATGRVLCSLRTQCVSCVRSSEMSKQEWHWKYEPVIEMTDASKNQLMWPRSCEIIDIGWRLHGCIGSDYWWSITFFSPLRLSQPCHVLLCDSLTALFCAQCINMYLVCFLSIEAEHGYASVLPYSSDFSRKKTKASPISRKTQNNR